MLTETDPDHKMWSFPNETLGGSVFGSDYGYHKYGYSSGRHVAARAFVGHSQAEIASMVPYAIAGYVERMAVNAIGRVQF